MHNGDEFQTWIKGLCTLTQVKSLNCYWLDFAILKYFDVF